MTIDTKQATLDDARVAARDAPRVTVRASDLVVVVRREQQGPELAQEPVLESDVADVFSELWRDGWLRTGKPDVPLDALSRRITARLAGKHGSKCEKLVFEASDGQGQTRSVEPAMQVFADVAGRASKSLLEAEILKAEDHYYYEVAIRNRPPEVQPDEPTFTVTAKNPPLDYLRVRVKPLLERAKTIGTVDEQTFPVFYTADAVLRAQEVAQKGADHEPPTETGGVLIGPLCSCPETGEFFVVVCDVLEARDTERSSFSLAYTAKTWSRIQAVMRARQSQHGHRAHRIVGQAHGHNFMPGGACAECEKVDQCTQTSVFVSLDDRTWSKAVFSNQPWQICQIFGLDARGRPMHAVFSLKDNALKQRGFHVLSDFDPIREETT